MADPKYANLPGLDLDQPDVFETNDLPEADQHDPSDFEDCSDFVETLHITASEAFGKFKGKIIETDGVDFSDRIRRSKRQGYVTWSGDYEVTTKSGGSEEKETLLQKYQRLNCEVRELMDELELAKEQSVKDEVSKKPGQSLAAIASQTSQLQDQLANLKLEETLGSELVKKLDDPRGAAKEKLLLQLEAMKNLGRSAGQREGKGGAENVGDGPITYELMMKPETSKMNDQARIAELDKRMETLENLISYSPDKMSALSVETNQKSVVGAIGVLSSKLSLLSTSHLDHVEGRLAALLQKMNTVAERKAVIEDAEKQSKISELYDLCLKTEAEAVALPQLVDRLDALQGLHEQASQFSKAMAQLDVVQQKLESNLSNNGRILTETQQKFTENLANIQKNFENVEQRLGKL